MVMRSRSGASAPTVSQVGPGQGEAALPCEAGYTASSQWYSAERRVSERTVAMRMACLEPWIASRSVIMRTQTSEVCAASGTATSAV
eukprot:572153-Prorocentrum_minimum.AAC.3